MRCPVHKGVAGVEALPRIEVKLFLDGVALAIARVFLRLRSAPRQMSHSCHLRRQSLHCLTAMQPSESSPFPSPPDFLTYLTLGRLVAHVLLNHKQTIDPDEYGTNWMGTSSFDYLSTLTLPNMLLLLAVESRL
jgi:hypothetical protein